MRNEIRDLIRAVVAELGDAILRIGHLRRAAQGVAPVDGEAVEPIAP